MIRIWKQDTTSDETYTESRILNKDIAAKISPYISKCQSISEAKIVSEISIEITSEFPPNDFFICFMLRIVSEGVKQLIESSNVKNVDFFPVQIFYDQNEYLDKRYFFMHILSEIDCFDKERSEYTIFQALDGIPETIKRIQKLYLLPVDTSVSKLFRVRDVGYFILCVDDQLAQQILDAGFTGMQFRDPSETYW
jgi:hypothetical protein